MGEGIAHIISPLSAPWCGWTMLVLMLCAILSEWTQPGIITQAYESLIVHTERTYKGSPNTFLGQFLMALFRIGTIGMALCLCVYQGTGFSFTAFAGICGLVVALVLVKMLVNVVINYTFALSNRFGNAYEIYADITTLAVLALYPIVLVMLRVDNPEITRWGAGVVALLFLGVWIYRSMRMYVVSPLAVVYLALYIGTLEVLPMASLYVLSDKMIAIL